MAAERASRARETKSASFKVSRTSQSSGCCCRCNRLARSGFQFGWLALGLDAPASPAAVVFAGLLVSCCWRSLDISSTLFDRRRRRRRIGHDDCLRVCACALPVGLVVISVFVFAGDGDADSRGSRAHGGREWRRNSPAQMDSGGGLFLFLFLFLVAIQAGPSAGQNRPSGRDFLGERAIDLASRIDQAENDVGQPCSRHTGEHSHAGESLSLVRRRDMAFLACEFGSSVVVATGATFVWSANLPAGAA